MFDAFHEQESFLVYCTKVKHFPPDWILHLLFRSSFNQNTESVSSFFIKTITVQM